MKHDQQRLVNCKKWWLSSGIGLMVLAFAAVAFAHATVLWAYVENNQVYVEAFFMGGNKIKNTRIVVVDDKGKKLIEGKTDEQGKFDFAPPIIDNMTILLLIDKAHRSEFKIKKEDFQQSEKCTEEPAVPPTQSSK